MSKNLYVNFILYFNKVYLVKNAVNIVSISKTMRVTVSKQFLDIEWLYVIFL